MANLNNDRYCPEISERLSSRTSFFSATLFASAELCCSKRYRLRSRTSTCPQPYTFVIGRHEQSQVQPAAIYEDSGCVRRGRRPRQVFAYNAAQLLQQNRPRITHGKRREHRDGARSCCLIRQPDRTATVCATSQSEELAQQGVSGSHDIGRRGPGRRCTTNMANSQALDLPVGRKRGSVCVALPAPCIDGSGQPEATAANLHLRFDPSTHSVSRYVTLCGMAAASPGH